MDIAQSDKGVRSSLSLFAEVVTRTIRVEHHSLGF